MISKEKIHNGFKDLVEQKIKSLEVELEAIKTSATSETKSSMGDKYETSREMMMQERNRLGGQLDVLINQLAALNSIDLDKAHATVAYGCFVETDDVVFYICAAIGSLQLEGQAFFAISGEAPLAKAMIGLKEGDSFDFNRKSIHVKSIA